MNSEVWYRHAVANRLQSFLLLSVMAGFLALLGWLVWGADGVMVLLITGAVLVMLNPLTTPYLIMRMYQARPLHPAEAAGLYRLLQTLAQRAGMARVPELYYVPSSVLNAFAVGRKNHGAIAVTDGLLRSLGSRELTAVLAHEISHLRSNDIWVMGLADMFSRMTGFLSLFGQILLLINLPLILLMDVSVNWIAILILILAPNLSALAQLGLSRTREYDADLNAARITGDPDALASALVKIERRQGGWLEQIFMPGRGLPNPSLLRTHPPTEERVRRLMELKHSPEVEQSARQPLFQVLPNDLFGNPISGPPRRRFFSGLWY